jgi:hypothetical protein
VQENLDVPTAVADGRCPGHVLVEITDILVPALKIKGVSIKGMRGKYATLVELGALPARVALPIEMFREHMSS